MTGNPNVDDFIQSCCSPPAENRVGCGQVPLIGYGHVFSLLALPQSEEPHSCPQGWMERSLLPACLLFDIRHILLDAFSLLVGIRKRKKERKIPPSLRFPIPKELPNSISFSLRFVNTKRPPNKKPAHLRRLFVAQYQLPLAFFVKRVSQLCR